MEVECEKSSRKVTAKENCKTNDDGFNSIQCYEMKWNTYRRKKQKQNGDNERNEKELW